jgi:BASS family bile acid:Na+ symporter
MSVLIPIVTLIVCRSFSLHPAVIVGLVTLSVAPVGALFSAAMMPLVAPGNAAYARGLLFASALLSVILTPVAVQVIAKIYGGDLQVPPLAIARVVLTSVLLPLGVGLLLGNRWPSTRGWIPTIQKTSGLVLTGCLIAILILGWSRIGLVLRGGTFTAIAIVTLAGLAIGHLLGGPESDDRTVLACAAVARHPGVALTVASFTNQELAPVGVMLAFLVSAIAAVPYKRWRQRLRASG